MGKLTEFSGRVIGRAIRLLPVSKKKAYFENFRGRGFGDDPRYIAEELHRRHPDMTIYWAVSDESIHLPEFLTPVKYASIAAKKAIATSAVWISNIKNSYKAGKNPSHFYVQTWHSTVGLKRNEEDAPWLDDDYLTAAKYDASITDLMFSDNDFRFDKYQNRFWYEGKVEKCDVPRIGVVLNRKDEFRKKIREQYGISEDNKIALYVPTFRNGKNTDVYDFDHSAYLKALEEKCSCDFELLMRLHPSMANMKFPWVPEKAIDVTAHADPYELIAAADVLISDYSDCMFEAILTDKPLFLIGTDYDHYVGEDRGFAIDTERLPVRITRNVEELCDEIRNFDYASYKSKCEEFKKYIGYSDGGNGDKVIVDFIDEFLSK